MLTPEQMDEAGELVAKAYRSVEMDMLRYLTRRIVSNDITGQRAQTSLLLLSQSMPLELRRILMEHEGEIDQAVRDEVERVLSISDAEDLRRLQEGMGVTLPEGTLTQQTVATVEGIGEILARDNLLMVQSAQSAFFNWSSWAATQVNIGSMTTEQALHKAVRELSRDGLRITEVVYKDPETGEKTVTNHVDVAVRRHIRSQMGQDAGRLTERRLDEAGCEFVEVSSHYGSRPSHAEWQGRCYHMGGAVTVGGVRYEDFYYGTGYQRKVGPYIGLADCLYGVNCRHSFGPYIPGTPTFYDQDPQHPSGLSNDEVYEWTQRQRAKERQIREAKRELADAIEAYNATGGGLDEVARAKALLRDRQAQMRSLIEKANEQGKADVLTRYPEREWAGDMPALRD